MKEIINLTKELIRFRSVHRKPHEIKRCADFVQNYLKNAGIRCQVFDYNNIPSIAVIPQTGYVPVMLMSHLDVVAGHDELFNPFEKNGKLYGRGSIDDKYAVALSLVLLKEHLQELGKQGKSQDELPFGVLITEDEETGGFNGAKEALKNIRTDFCIALDGGGLNTIVVKQKGIVKLKLISKGKAAHGSRPWLGENAIEKLINDYAKIKKMFNQSDPNHWHRTVNLGIIHSGKPDTKEESFNQVPDYAEAVLDIRYTENDDIDSLIEKMQKELSSEVRTEYIEPLFFGGESPYLAKLLDISKNTRLGFAHGASDARFLSEYGIEGIVWGADGDLSSHSDDEHVNIESVYELYQILNEFMKKLGT